MNLFFYIEIFFIDFKRFKNSIKNVVSSIFFSHYIFRTTAHHKNQRFVESTKFPTIIKTRYMDSVWCGIYFYIKIIYQTLVFRIVEIWIKFQRPEFTSLIFVGNFQRKKKSLNFNFNTKKIMYVFENDEKTWF